MKKVLVASALSLVALCAGQQKASAWSEIKFGAGVNFSWSSGGNRFLWGLYQSSPYPGCGPAGCGFPTYGGGFGGGFDGGGVQFAPGGWNAPAPSPGPGSDKPSGGSKPEQTVAPVYYNTAYNNSAYYNTGYQPVGYYYPSYYQQQAPSYWYGR